MRRLLPKSLAGQLIALLLIALVVSQLVSLVILLDERRLAVRAANREQVLQRTATLVQLLADTPSSLHQRIVQGASTPRLRFWIERRSVLEGADSGRLDAFLARQLSGLLDRPDASGVRVRVHDRWEPWLWPRPWEALRSGARHHPGHFEDDDDDDDDEASGYWHREREILRRHRQPLSLTISVALDDGRWLNVATALPPPPRGWAWPTLLSMLVMAAAILVIVIVMVRRIARPMRALATAADALGRGEEVPPLVAEGPADVRQTTQAFNAMRARLQRFVQDRTRMLAAMSHDLRTPITSLRLRAEFIEDRETREKILETLQEMQRMTEATLAFAREEAAQESTRSVDLAALLASLCDDLAELGMPVTFAEAERCPYACRPVSLKRAIRNLIENAVTYGQRARVALSVTPGEAIITVDDDGPGIAEADRERVFQPFVRLEESRSRETGGVGLGLAIARSIVHGHGGEVSLDNRPEGGLRASIRLPREGAR